LAGPAGKEIVETGLGWVKQGKAARRGRTDRAMRLITITHNDLKFLGDQARDGDLQSAMPQGGSWTTPDDKEASLRMYAQDEAAGSTDFVTLINDNARVYKGGSWKDKAYWLNPSTRRFLDQQESRDDIGFRCAMIRVGSPAGF
jgi:hypothetical protein